MCLTTSLARHGLADEIPARIDIALPCGYWQPKTSAPTAWHSFHPATFDVGRDLLLLTTELSIGIYDPPRSIIDAYRLRHREGPDLAITTLKRWLDQPGNQPTTLLTLATHFPATESALRTTLETVLA